MGTALSSPRRGHASASVGNYALFAGGVNTNSDILDTGDIYDNFLSRSTLSLPYERRDLTGVSIGNYALFGGGVNSWGSDKNEGFAYNTTLVRSTLDVLSNGGGSGCATSVGNYAIFGGLNQSYYADAYSSTLTKIRLVNLPEKAWYRAATAGNYAIFLTSYFNRCAAYDTSLTQSSPPQISGTIANYFNMTSTGNYALVDHTYQNKVSAYNTSLTIVSAADISSSRNSKGEGTIKGFGLFAGGNGYSSVVDVYDSALTRTNPAELAQARSYTCAAITNNYIIFGGGMGVSGSSTSNALNVVDIYQVK